MMVGLMSLETMLNKDDFGKCFLNTGLEKSAVAAASVVEGPSRCSNKGGGKKRRCLQHVCENHLFHRRRGARG